MRWTSQWFNTDKDSTKNNLSVRNRMKQATALTRGPKNCMYNIITCSWKPSNYAGLLQRLADRLTAESATVQGAQEGCGATVQVVCCFEFSHGPI